MAYAIIVVGLLAVLASYNPKYITNHIPHALLPEDIADKVQRWLESF